MASLARITEIVEPEVKALGFDLVRVLVFGKTEVGDEDHTLQIMAENPATGQLLLGECAALSRRISDRIDEAEDAGEVLIEEAYRLEVSSPGIDRPLTRLKDWVRFAGHVARVELALPIDGRRRCSAIIVEANEARVILRDAKGDFEVPMPDIRRAKLVLTDELIAASAPDSASDEDVVEDEPAPAAPRKSATPKRKAH